MSTALRAIANPAPWAANPELPRIAWATYGPATPKPRTPVGKPVEALRTHCPSGHPYDDANTYRTKDGRRLCRACRADQHREYTTTIRATRALPPPDSDLGRAKARIAARRARLEATGC